MGGAYSSQAPARPTGTPPVHRLEYDGRLGPLYCLFIVNLLLSSVTFGIYRFWGRTNIRRYIWSNTRFLGDPFEYTGKGSELFAGFLIVCGILVAVLLLLQIATIAIGFESLLMPVLDIAVVIAVIYFVLVGQYAAQRYRLTRTVWRGLRGGMTGSAWSYGAYALGVTLLTALTLTIARPWARARLIERRLSNCHFGDARITVAFSSRPLFPSYLAGLAAFATGLAIAGATWILFIENTEYVDRAIERVLSIDDAGVTRDPDVIVLSLLFLIAIYFLAMLTVALLHTLSFAWFQAATARAVASHAHFQDLRFSSSATGGTMAQLAFGNFFLIVLTAGFAMPIVIQRSIRYVVCHLHIDGALDVERLQPIGLAKPLTGEGLIEAFDPALF